MILGDRHRQQVAGAALLQVVDHDQSHEVVDIVAHVGVEDEFHGRGLGEADEGEKGKQGGFHEAVGEKPVRVWWRCARAVPP